MQSNLLGWLVAAFAAIVTCLLPILTESVKTALNRANARFETYEKFSEQLGEVVFLSGVLQRGFLTLHCSLWKQTFATLTLPSQGSIIADTWTEPYFACSGVTALPRNMTESTSFSLSTDSLREKWQIRLTLKPRTSMP